MQFRATATKMNDKFGTMGSGLIGCPRRFEPPYADPKDCRLPISGVSWRLLVPRESPFVDWFLASRDIGEHCARS